jgi:hypothetical protein
MELIVKGADFSANRIGVVEKKINTATFNGTSSFASFTAFTLSSDGDYVEFLMGIEEITMSKYFAYRQLWNRPVLGITTTKLSLRLDDQTWAVNNETINLTDASNAYVKIAYEGTSVKVYIDDVLTFTYDNSITQANLTFAGFAKYQATGDPDFWKGSIKKMRTNKIKSGEWFGVDELPGWNATDVVLS